MALLVAAAILFQAWGLPQVAHTAYLWARANYLYLATSVASLLVAWALRGQAQRAVATARGVLWRRGTAAAVDAAKAVRRPVT